jgi:cytochrome c oxidase subunit 3
MMNVPKPAEEIKKSSDLSPSNYRAVRFSMLFFIVTQIVTFVVLFEAKYLYDGFYVSPDANQAFGAVAAAVMALSAIMGWQAVRAGRHQHDREAAGTWLKIAAGLGLVAILMVIYQWGMRYSSPQGRFGEMYYIISGADIVYAVVGLIMLGVAILRNIRQDMTPERFWTAEASVYFWTFVALAWIASWIGVYLL